MTSDHEGKRSDQRPSGDSIRMLQKRARELACLYEIEEILGAKDARIEDLCARIVRVILRV